MKSALSLFHDFRIIKYLVSLVFKKNKIIFLIFLCVTIISSLLMSMFPFFFPSGENNQALNVYGFILISGLFFSKFAQYLSTYLDNKVYKHLSIQMFSLSINNSEFINESDRAQLLNLNEHAAESASVLINSFFSKIFPFALQIILIVFFSIYNIGLQIGLLLAASSLIQCIASVLASQRLKTIQQKVITSNAEAYGNASEVFMSSKTLSSLRIVDVFISIFTSKRTVYENEVDKYIVVRLVHDIFQVLVILTVIFLSFYFLDYDVAKIITVNFIVLFVLQGFDSIGSDIISIVDSITNFKSSAFAEKLLDFTEHNKFNFLNACLPAHEDLHLQIKHYENLGFSLQNPITFRSGEITVISGESGAGKTTLLESIIGLNTANKSSEILLNNVSVDKYPTNVLKDLFSFAYHDTDIFSGDLVFNISLSLDDVDQTRFNSLISELNLNLTNRNDFHPNTLSSGEKIRIGIARALYQKRRVFLFDEPTANLDSYNRMAVIDILCKLSQKHIVICTTHDLDLVKVAKTNICFQDRKISIL